MDDAASHAAASNALPADTLAAPTGSMSKIDPMKA